MVHKMKTLNVFLLFLILSIAFPAFGATIGSITRLKGQGWIERGNDKIPAVAGERLLVNDTLKTGPDGAIGITLHDDTIISMGPRSEMQLAEFIFQPDKKRFVMLTKFFTGTFSYLSGLMAKLAPENVKVETPVGMVAIRGTHFLVKIEE